MFSKIFSLFKSAKAPLSARELLKEATQLKKEKRYDEACNKLNEAYSASGSEDLMMKDFLRLPMYLQLAGKNDEGWRVLNELNVKYTDVFSQADIANQMRVFLQKEKKFKLAVQFSAWSICKQIERDYSNIKDSEKMTDQMAKINSDYSLEDDSAEKAEVFGKTKKGNAITDKAYPMFKDRIEHFQSPEGLLKSLKSDLKKAKLSSIETELSQALSDYLISTKRYQLAMVRDIIDDRVNGI
ncbi:hypothetical protein [Thalassotalea sp. Y01]|uniref:hypothetical protein n=1 Tax=Thalassotalea sp. Y01 TaxID=2729613 RepID=UPI00145D49EE|nr:hypothetical protein [Thalassotalea sp. Y01]NMP15366.1 hypothetical protein [Thalassotalea sp. Y01]